MKLVQGSGGTPLQKTVTLDYLSKYRVQNNNHAEQYRVENNHEGIISKELWDMAQKELQRRFEIYSGKNKDRSKYTKRYAFSGKIICGICGTTFKRRHWNVNTPAKKVVWQCINYIKKDAETGKRCEARAVDDEVLKAAFVKVYNEKFNDKGNFIKAFLANVEKVIEKNNYSAKRITDKIKVLEGDISEMVTLKLRKQIDEETYSREYQRLNKELTEMKIQKDELDRTSLQRSKDVSKMAAVKKLIGDGTQMLTEFDEDLFDAMVRKIVVKSKTELEFWFESGEVVLTHAR